MADAAVSLSVKLDGLDDIIRQLGYLPDSIQKKYVRQGMYAAIALVRAKARELAPRKSGKLRRSIRIKASLPKGSKNLVEVIGTASAGGKAAYYAHMLEGGTKPHRIAPNRKQALLINGSFVRVSGGVTTHAIGRSTVRKKSKRGTYGILHPGVAARHFMQQAGQDVAPQAARTFFEYIQRRIDEDLAKGTKP